MLDGVYREQGSTAGRRLADTAGKGPPAQGIKAIWLPSVGASKTLLWDLVEEAILKKLQIVLETLDRQS